MNIHFIKSVLRAAAMATLIVLASTLMLPAQDEVSPNFNAVPTGKGIMLMSKKGVPGFAFLIEGGSDPKYDPKDGGMRLKTQDGGEIAVYLVEAKSYQQTTKDEPNVLMKNYRARLIPPIEVSAAEKITVAAEVDGVLPVFDLRGGKDDKSNVYASSWNFAVNGARRVYLAFVIGDSILTLRKDMPDGGGETDEQNEAFMSTLKTLTLMPPQQILPKKEIPMPKKKPAKPAKKRN